MLEHGGNIDSASKQWGIAREKWLDLSTGVSPRAWQPPTELPEHILRAMPYPSEDLLNAARRYYNNARPLALPGSQAAIQLLPQCFTNARVLMPSLCYAEHAHHWQAHDCHYFKQAEPGALARAMQQHQPDVLLLVNPCNPCGFRYSRQTLLDLLAQQAARGGYLIVDEAFADTDPSESIADVQHQRLIVLRSIGKFFGLAGLRLGFVLAADAMRQQLAELLGPWPVSGVSEYWGALALEDQQWQSEQRLRIQAWSHAQEQLLVDALGEDFVLRNSGLFISARVSQERVEAVYQQCAAQGILLRRFSEDPELLRLGLCSAEDLPRLAAALQNHASGNAQYQQA